MKESAKNILLFFVSILFSLLLIESGFKILHLFMDVQVSASKIKGLPYENTPNGWFIKSSRHQPLKWIFYKHNSLGMRDPERSFDKKGIRVLCLGDSILYGGEVPFEEMFTRHMERILGFEVLNTGTTSYSLREYNIYLKEKGIKFRPDVVVVALCLNDYISYVSDNKSDSLIKEQKPKYSKWERLFHSYLIEYVREIARKPLACQYESMLDRQAWLKNIPLIKEISRTCEAAGAKLLFVIFPVREQYEYLKDDPRPQDCIKEMCSSLGIPCIDLRPELDPSSYSKRDGLHPMPKGQRLAAKIISARIKELLAVKNGINR